jgi:hypothetical protein
VTASAHGSEVRTGKGPLDANGSIDASGRFVMKSVFGVCTGQVSGGRSREICTNWAGQSCYAVYRQAD